MKKLLLIIWITSISMAASAQKMSFADLYDKYSGRTGFTTVDISGDMIRMLGGGSVEVNGDRSVSETLEGIQSIRIIVAKDVSDDSFLQDMEEIPSDKDYKLMTSVREGPERQLMFYYKDKKERDEKAPQSEFLILISGEQNIAINITGDLNVKNVTKLSKINITGLDELEKTEETEEE